MLSLSELGQPVSIVDGKSLLGVVSAALKKKRYSGGKASVSSDSPGTTVWVRVPPSVKGVMGAWSDPAKIIVV